VSERSGGPWQRGTRADVAQVQWTFPLHPRSVSLARTAAAYVCRLWRASAATDDAQLAVSELFGNAVTAARGDEATLRMSFSPRRLRVEVCDDCSRLPTLREAELFEESGRGLWLVRETAVRWGTLLLPRGKCVWAEFALPAAA
jgi:hypothetical protein